MTSRSTVGAVAVAGLLAAAPVALAQRRPAATAAKLPAEVLALACAPKVAYEPPDTPLRVTGGQDSIVRHLHAPGPTTGRHRSPCHSHSDLQRNLMVIGIVGKKRSI